MARIQNWGDAVQALQRPIWFCIASGPSLTQADCDLVGALHLERPDVGVAVVNNSWMLAPWADILFAGDQCWWGHYAKDAREFKGVKLSWASTTHAIKVPHENGMGLGRKKCRSGSNSGYKVVNIAYLLGARLIILLGFDMKKDGDRMHWHPDHGGRLQNNGNLNKWKRNFGHIARDLESEGVRVVNGTRDTALGCFERMRLESAIALCHSFEVGRDIRAGVSGAAG